MKTELVATLHDSALITRAGNWINETIKDIHRRSNFIYLKVASTLTTVADQTEYNYSDIAAATSNDDVDKILNIRDKTNDFNLVPMSFNQIYDFEPDPEDDATQLPTFYYIKDQIVGFVPTPSDVRTLDVDYKKRPADLAADTDTPDLPIEWVDMIMLGAEARGLRYQKRQDWLPTQQFFEQQVRSYIADDTNQPKQGFKFAKPGVSPEPLIPRIKVRARS
jgi:hypothetical protein